MSWFDNPDNMLSMQKWGNLLSAGTAYMADKEQADAKRKWQAYSNAMVNISNAQDQNAISSNETMAVQDAVQKNVNVQRGGLIFAAKEQVQAAAAGVQGRSVNQSLMDIQAQAADKERNNQIDLQNKLQGYAQQREQKNLNAAQEQNYSYIAAPNAGTYLLGAMTKNPILGLDDPAQYQ